MSNRLCIGIDLQDGFLTEEIKQSGYVAKVEKFLATQDKANVVLTRFINTPDSSFVKLLDWPDMQKGEANTKLFGSLEESGYTIVEKASYTGWLPEIISMVRATGRDEVVIFGLDSDACVLKTALDAFEAGVRPIVLTDLCDCSGGAARNEAGLKLLKVLVGEDQLMTSTIMLRQA